MSKIGLLISVWEYELIREEKFWKKIENMVDKKKINSIGFSLMSPYGLTYASKILKKYVYSDDFTDLFLKNLFRIVDNTSEIQVSMWCSLLYNTYFSNETRQVSSEGELSRDFVCPNRLRTVEQIRAILKDIFDQPWFSQLTDVIPQRSFVFDGAHFHDLDYCACEQCTRKFKDELRRDSLTQSSQIPLAQRLMYRWTCFRSRSVVKFLQKMITLLNKHSSKANVVYGGFSIHNPSVLSGPIRNGSILSDYLKIDTDQVIIKGSEDWFSDPETIGDLQFALPFWRDMFMTKGKSITLLFHGQVLSNDIQTIDKLARENFIDQILFAPMSTLGLTEVFKYLYE